MRRSPADRPATPPRTRRRRCRCRRAAASPPGALVTDRQVHIHTRCHVWAGDGRRRAAIQAGHDHLPNSGTETAWPALAEAYRQAPRVARRRRSAPPPPTAASGEPPTRPGPPHRPARTRSSAGTPSGRPPRRRWCRSRPSPSAARRRSRHRRRRAPASTCAPARRGHGGHRLVIAAGWTCTVAPPPRSRRCAPGRCPAGRRPPHRIPAGRRCARRRGRGCRRWLWPA